MDADTDPLHPDITTTTPDENERGTDLKHTIVERVFRLLQLVLANVNYRQAERNAVSQHRTMIIIEEAHKFLSFERIKQMPILYLQVAHYTT